MLRHQCWNLHCLAMLGSFLCLNSGVCVLSMHSGLRCHNIDGKLKKIKKILYHCNKRLFYIFLSLFLFLLMSCKRWLEAQIADGMTRCVFLLSFLLSIFFRLRHEQKFPFHYLEMIFYESCSLYYLHWNFSYVIQYEFDLKLNNGLGYSAWWHKANWKQICDKTQIIFMGQKRPNFNLILYLV